MNTSASQTTNVASISNPQDLEFSTAPPVPRKTLSRLLKQNMIGWFSVLTLPLVTRVAREYVGGETVDDALCVARRWANENRPNTLGFWDTADYSGRDVADVYLNAIQQMSSARLKSYLSIKPPALRFDTGFAAEIAKAAHTVGVPLHCDSHGPEVADVSCRFVEALLIHTPGHDVGTTLPGRWLRSLSDADWAIERGLSLRVVKGQWPDPADPNRDVRGGFLELIDRLAGRARHVRIASHDLPLVTEAVARLRAKNTSFEIEVLFGMPSGSVVRWATENNLCVRIYIPFGKGYIPSAIGVLRRNPKLVWRLVRGLWSH